MKNRRAVILLSGGLDSAVAATIAKCERYDLYALTFDYGQRNLEREMEAAKAVASSLRVKEHKIVKLPLGDLATSALTTTTIPVPKSRPVTARATGIPSTYVPARNTVFLACALGYAESIPADSIYIGAHSQDYSGYPDCRPEYFEAWNELAPLATKQSVDGKPPKILAPLVGWTKAKIIESGRDLNAPLKATWSCYEGGKKPCGKCDACQFRAEAFAAVGLKDPAVSA